MIGVALFIFNVQVELFQICKPLLMVIVLQISLCLSKLKRSVFSVDDHLLPHNVMLPLSASLHDGIDLFIIGGILPNCIEKCLTMIGHWIPMLGEDYTNSIVRGVCLNFKWLLQVWQCEYQYRVDVVPQLNECLLLGLRPRKLCFLHTLIKLTQRPSDMGESQHEPPITICKAQKVVKLC